MNISHTCYPPGIPYTPPVAKRNESEQDTWERLEKISQLARLCQVTEPEAQFNYPALYEDSDY